MAGSADYVSMALAQAIISGLMFVACSVLKLGFLATFLSKPILVGFVGGLALDILVSQVAKMLGVPIESGGEFLDKVGQLVAGLDTVNWISLVISSMPVAVLLVGRRLNGSAPWALVVLVVATLAVVWADLASRGVSVLGPVQAGPPQLTVPHLELNQWLSLVPSAVALTMVTMAEGLPGLTQLRGQERVQDRPEPRPRGLRRRQHRLRSHRRVRRGFLDIENGGHGPGRLSRN